jgi:DNA-binding NtrC family response regulator
MQLGDATILVVDDQQAVRRVARRVLTRAGFAIYGAASAQQALEIFREQHREIDLVLLDLTMPGLGGEEALHRIKEIDPEARVVLMSGFDETDAMKRLDGAKLGGFLHKPWEPAELLSAVHRALGLRKAGRG